MAAEVDERMLRRFKTEVDKKKHIEGLEHWKQELHEQIKVYLIKISGIIKKDLSQVHTLLHYVFHANLRDGLEVKKEYQNVLSNNRFDTMVFN